MSSLYPVFIKLEGKSCLVAGGGEIAAGKVRALIEAGARVTVVSPELAPELAAGARCGRIRWLPRRFEEGDLAGAFIAIAATDDPEVSRRVFAEAERLGILCNAVDQDAYCTFHAPAVAARGDIQIAISTAGKSPAFASHLRERIEAVLGDADARFVRELGRLRRRVIEKFAGDLERRKRVFKGLVAAFKEARAASTAPRGPALRLEELFEADALAGARPGRAYLVGAGPGDPGLLTLRGAVLLATADVVFYDRLAGRRIVDWIPAGARKEYVGREAGESDPLDTGAILVEAARAGKSVVRLKGGDPNLFGRGGDEMLALLRAGIDFEVVPGVTALTAVPAAAGIPVTFRDLSHQVVARSGYRPPDPASPRLPPPSPIESTYVYFMTAGRLTEIVRELREEDGLGPETPIAVIQRGTLPDQAVLGGTLGDILERAARAPIRPPSLVVAGAVARFAEREGLLKFIDDYRSNTENVTNEATHAAPGRSGEVKGELTQ